MRVINQYHKIESKIDRESVLKEIESAGRTCYKSEAAITEKSAARFVTSIMISGHFSVIEHVSVRVRFVTDRGVSHELVRHRLASYSQESTRYANYSKDRFGNEITVIKPVFWEEDSVEYQVWRQAMEAGEKVYMKLIGLGAQAEQARSVLPNSLKTEIVMTCNLREWLTVFSLRTTPKAHPQMRALMLPLLSEMKKMLPEIFGGIQNEKAKESS